MHLPIGIDQLQRLRNLNMELLEATIHLWHYVEDYAKVHSIPLPVNDREIYLVGSVQKLCEEIDEEVALPPNFKRLVTNTSRRLYRTCTS